MKIKIIVIILFTILSCSLKQEKPISEHPFEGWAGNPKNPHEKPFDYFYMHRVGRASPKAIAKKNQAMMQATCTDMATTQAKGDLIGKLIYESTGLNETVETNDFLSLAEEENVNSFASYFNAISLAGIGGEGRGSSTGFALVRELYGKLQGVNVKDCKPTAIPNPDILGSEWTECNCILYVYIKGGRDAIRGRAKEMDKD